jgi:hypothetical protein
LRPWSFTAFLILNMAYDEKRFELKLVDEESVREIPIVRLESEETLHRAKPVRLGVPPEQAEVSQRLELPEREDYESRTHQPGIEALIEMEAPNPDFMEQDWGEPTADQWHLPWGWFALILLILGAATLWSLSAVKKGEFQMNENRVATESKVGEEARELLEASQLIDRINQATQKFFDTTDIDQLAQLSRQTERVKPLMMAHYDGKPIPHNSLARSLALQPLTLDNRANFWMESVELADKQQLNLLIEVLENGEPRIDWETLVCYQPMRWEEFANQRPTGKSFDFRIYAIQDNFFSHEFSESGNWNCFRLSVRGGEETLFGYAKADSAISKQILELLRKNQGQVTSMILRLTIPDGTQSRRGLVIEKLLSSRWIYLDPPDV